MSIHRLIFSPTGGTQRAADALTSTWTTGTPLHDTDLTRPDTDCSHLTPAPGDLILIAVPSYGGRVPALAAQRIAALHGNGAACVLLCTYGNRAYEDTLIELADLATRSGLHIIAAVAAATEHSIIHRYGTGRPDTTDRQQLQQYGQSILGKHHSGHTGTPDLPGQRPYKPLSSIKLIPLPNDTCNHCGHCAANCPASAIDPDTLSTDSTLCISCMRCISICPQSARQLPESIISTLTQALAPVCTTRKPNQLFL